MLKKRPLFLLSSSFVMLVAAGPALALGFGASTPAAVIGQTLNFTVALRLDPSEAFQPECARAGVTMGERVLPSGEVHTSVEPGADGQPLVRVRSLAPVTEPVVTIEVSSGCTARISRRYVVFADPPLIVAPPAVAAAPAAPAEPVPGAAVTRRAPAAATAPQDPPRLASTVRVTGPTDAAAPPARRPPAKAKRAPRPPRPSAVTAPARVATPNLAAVSRPRLRLDAAPEASQSSLSDEALATVDEANRAIESAIQAASAAQLRITTLEAGMERMRLEGEAQRATIQELNTRAAQAERRSQWVLPLLGLALALVGVAGWLWSRLRVLESERQAAWWLAAQEQAAEAVAEPGVQSEVAASAQGRGEPAIAPEPLDLSSAWDAAEESQRLKQTGVFGTQSLVQEGAVPSAESRGVSAEELIDLEQQAEFFVVLGQDDAAIDLLVGHLRETGGTSPLPYLKLLDIYHRLGDAEAYERTRGRFNRRFNAHAPAWGAAIADGRALEDYPAVMHWIQRVWPKPLDAMAELESMLFRRDGGELFELPAYRELLFLYALARDLLTEDDPEGATLGIDLLLPMTDGPTPDASAQTTPSREPDFAQRADDDELDIDLTLSGDLTRASDLPTTR